MEIFRDFGVNFAFRWLHIVVGIMWIGLLYYFNVVQVPSFAEMEASARGNALDKLSWRALWWFRWAAAATFVTGLVILGTMRDPTDNSWLYGLTTEYWGSIGGTSILTGTLLGITMFLNVWLVIWPAQRVVIESIRGVAAGREADPAAAPAGRRALLASRTNFVFSIPMVFFMTATSHFANISYTTAGGLLAYWTVTLVIWAFVEANALGLLGGTGPGPLRRPLESHRDSIIAGFVVWVVLYMLWEAFLK